MMSNRSKKEEAMPSRPPKARPTQVQKRDEGQKVGDETCGVSSIQMTVVKQMQKEQASNYRSMTNMRKGTHPETEDKNGRGMVKPAGGSRQKVTSPKVRTNIRAQQALAHTLKLQQPTAKKLPSSAGNPKEQEDSVRDASVPLQQTFRETFPKIDKGQQGMAEGLQRCQQADTKLIIHSTDSAQFEQRLREEFETAARVMRQQVEEKDRMHKLQIFSLQKDNAELKTKVSKLKALNQDYKKSLKEQISSFNQEGQIQKRHREEVQQLNNRIKQSKDQLESAQKALKAVESIKANLEMKLGQAYDEQTRSEQKIAGLQLTLAESQRVIEQLGADLDNAQRVIRDQEDKNGLPIYSKFHTAHEIEDLSDVINQQPLGRSNPESPKSLDHSRGSSVDKNDLANVMKQEFMASLRQVEHNYNKLFQEYTYKGGVSHLDLNSRKKIETHGMRDNNSVLELLRDPSPEQKRKVSRQAQNRKATSK